MLPIAHVDDQQEKYMTQPRSDVLQGTLDLMVLKTLETLGSMHGYGIAQRLHQVSSQALHLNQGTLYPALLRLEQRGWITAAWGTTENNRRAKYYSLTKAGRSQLTKETAEWMRVVNMMGRLLNPDGAQ
jgi:transcriptional regulator